MDRRSLLTTLVGKKAGNKTKLEHFKQKLSATKTAAGPLNTSLNPHSGPWQNEQAAHLLRRTIYGPTKQQIKDVAADGMEATVSQLLATLPLPQEPVNYNYPDDPLVPIGESWVDKAYTAGNLNPIKNSRRRSLFAWTTGNLLNEGVSIREKMTLFWHNHFVVELATVNDPSFLYIYINTLRENALGNFRALVKKVTVDPAMLIYLTGFQNTSVAPNENYARELLELFTIGKGPSAGPGDYTNYTEDDVIEVAKIMTGWRIQGFNKLNENIAVGSFFVNNRHDTSTKTLSHRFDNAEIQNNGDQEYADLIDVIFLKDEVARFICRKLYRWFVYYKIDDDIETNVIEPLAQIMIANDYELKPVLETLLKSEHFYSMDSVGPMIKNPIDFVTSLAKQFEITIPGNYQSQYGYWLGLSGQLEGMEMSYYLPPNVAGWKAYYQEPVFYQHWINSVTLPIRMAYTETMAGTGIRIGQGNQLLARIDVLAFAAQAENSLDPNVLIEEFVEVLFPQPITDNQIAYLKEILIPGLPDFEWTVEYGDYLANPDDDNLKRSVENKLMSMINAMLSMPEYYLS